MKKKTEPHRSQIRNHNHESSFCDKCKVTSTFRWSFQLEALRTASRTSWYKRGGPNTQIPLSAAICRTKGICSSQSINLQREHGQHFLTHPYGPSHATEAAQVLLLQKYDKAARETEFNTRYRGSSHRNYTSKDVSKHTAKRDCALTVTRILICSYTTPPPTDSALKDNIYFWHRGKCLFKPYNRLLHTQVRSVAKPKI